MKTVQKEFNLKPRARGFHLVTGEIINNVPEINDFETGIAQIFICHTSASLTLNENAEYYRHTLEGSDDMPAHIKSSLLGSSLTIPVKNGRFNLGTWQGIYLCEHRNNGGPRKIIVTILG